MPTANPFTPSFGQIPPFMAGREHIIADLTRAFDTGGANPNLCTIFVGARGAGKTALLSYMSQEASSRGWIVADVSARPGMLEDIEQRAAEAGENLLANRTALRVKGVKVAGVGVELERPTGVRANWRTRMNSLFTQLDRTETGLLITVDEVRVDLDEMVQLASDYQHFVREGRRVGLLMAGLPYKVSALLRNDSVSFLRRAQSHKLGRIEDYEIEGALAKTVEHAGRSFAPDALERAVQSIDGFPYMMQLVGYRAWEVSPQEEAISLADVEAGVRRARKEMRSRILETTYLELSDGDLRFLTAMLPDAQESSVADIAKRMGVASNYASQYKRRLLEDGVIGMRGRSKVAFDIPAFREYLEEKLDEAGVRPS